MPWVAAIAAIGAAVVGGVAGAISKGDAGSRADMLRKDAIRTWLAVNIPDPEQQKLALQQFVVSGKLSPQMETAIKQDPSAWQNVVQDQGLKASQTRSLRSLEDLGTGKDTFESQAAQEKALIESNAAARGHQQAITDSLAQRGQLGSGLELTARMGQNQADDDRAAKAALGIESDRRTNALKALTSAGSLAGQMSAQDLSLQGKKSQASDAINAFNTNNSRDVQAANTKSANNAQQTNLVNQQDISNKNIALNNYQQQANKNLNQQQFENQTKVAAGVTGQYNQAADQANANGKSSADFWGNMAGNAPKVISAFGSSDDDKKKDDDVTWAGTDSSSSSNIA